MFDQLSERFQEAFSVLSPANLTGNATLTPENMQDAIKTVRRALLEADVSLRVVKQFILNLQEKVEGEAVLKSVSPAQQFIKLVNDELTATLGQENKPLQLAPQPATILLFGLQGAGKTTTAAKLALHLRKKQQLNPYLIAADVYRPAAMEQLVSLGKQIQVPVFAKIGETDPLKIVREGIAEAKTAGHHPIIVDTAGRTQLDTDMMAELLLLEKQLGPQEKLLVVDAMMGQEALNVAETFHTQLGISGLVLTKMDGDTRGGAALSLVAATGCPIKFIGTSEKPDGLEPFYPDRLASRILGMGDVVGLVERAQEAIDMSEAKALEKKMRKAEFSLEDFMNMQGMLSRFGSLDTILNMLPIPGMTKDTKELLAHGSEKAMAQVQCMISSMTVEERQNPQLIKGNRLSRIAKGCGKPEAEISQFLKQFEQMRAMMKQMMGFMPKTAPGKKHVNPLFSMPRRKRPF